MTKLASFALAAVALTTPAAAAKTAPGGVVTKQARRAHRHRLPQGAPRPSCSP